MNSEMKAKWHEAALEDLENTSMSYTEIAMKYGRARDTIIKLLRLYNVTRKNPVRSKGAVKAETKRPLSPRHSALGSRLTLWRANRTYSDISDGLNMSGYQIRMTELGLHDITLSQLVRLSEAMELEISALVAPLDRVHQQASDRVRRLR